MKISHFDLMKENPLSSVCKEAFKEAAKQTESELMSQLNELIKRGLLVVEETQPLLVKAFESAEHHGYEVRMERGVRLVLKDQEYVQSLEKKIVDLEAKVLELDNNIFQILTNIPKEMFEKIVALKQPK
jgi:CO dehydrogenase/acetyl-CoA synthase gamma subunit (corrinoid Fe-S protein)